RRLIESVDLASAPIASTLRVDALDGAAARERPREYLELAFREDRRSINEIEAEAGVGTIRAVALHSIGPRDPSKRDRQVMPGLVHDLAHDLFHHRHDVIGFDEAHLDVDLGELRLAVRAQVLVAETARDLIVALDPTHHEHLL